MGPRTDEAADASNSTAASAAPVRSDTGASSAPRGASAAEAANGRSNHLPTGVIRDLRALQALTPAWDRTAGASAAPMQQAAWAHACAATLRGPDEALHVVVRSSAGDVAIAPLAWRRGLLGRLELLEMRALREVTDVVSTSPAALEDLANALARSRLPLVFDRIAAESPFVSALKRAYRGRGLVVVRPASASPWIPLDSSWREPERHLNSGRRSDLRRARRIAGRYGWIRVEILSPTPDELALRLEEAFKIEASGWKGRAGTALSADWIRGAFVRHYATTACQRGQLRLCFLRLGGKAAAMQLAVEAAGAFWLLKIAYDDEFSRCSPGTLLMLETIRHAASRGLRSYELLGTVEPWTGIWTHHVRPSVSLRAYPASGRGILTAANDLAVVGRRLIARAFERRH